MSSKPVRQLAGRLRDQGALRLRQAVADTVNADGTVDVTVAGDDVVVPNVALLGTAVPAGGLWLLQQAGDLLALGTPGTGAAVHGRTTDATSFALDASERSVLAVDLTIPSSWTSWAVEYGFTIEWRSNTATANRVSTWRVRHGTLAAGTVVSTVLDNVLTLASPDRGVLTFTGASDGRTGTGTQTIRLTGLLAANDAYDARSRMGWARAWRTG